tara:strand:+ start:16 stop:351 length:336 start_codon:yes stop_codon:yes gene_type:complete
MNLTVKKLDKNSRNITHLAIDKTNKNSLIYFRGVSKITGDVQWYESKINYQLKEAEEIYSKGDIANVFSAGIIKSKKQNWHKTQKEIDSERKKLEKLSKEDLINLILNLKN